MSDVMIAAAVAASVAVIGLIVNNIVTHLNTGRQLEHDREQKTKERSLTLRRDIYLGLAEYLYDSLVAISSFADLNLEHKEIINTWRKTGHYSAKLNFMAKEELLDAMSVVNEAITKTVVKVAGARQHLTDLQQNISVYDDFIKDHRNGKELALQALRQKNVEGLVTTEVSDRLLRMVAAEGDEAARLTNVQNSLRAQLKEKAAQLAILAICEQGNLYPLLVPVACAVRKELGETIDMAAYEKVLKRAMAIAEQYRPLLQNHTGTSG